MKKILSSLFLSVMIFSMLLVPTNSVSAQAVPLESSIQIQNLDNTNPANIFIYYYDESGALVNLPDPYANPVQDTIDPGSSNTYLPVHPDAGFKGSAVVSSDSPIAIISNLTIAATNRALGTYVGAAGGGDVVYFPLVDKRNNVSLFSIQNTGTGNATIVVDFVPLPGSSYANIPDINDTIAEGASHSYNMASIGTGEWLGSVKVTATTGTIAGVLANINQTNPASPTNGVYNGMSSGSKTVVLPLVMEANNGNRTGTSCQNLGPEPATITMTYLPEAGNPPRNPDVFQNVPVNGIATKLFLDTGTRWVGSSIATISGSNTIACVVNQSRPTLRRSNIYEGFDPAAATDTIVLPLIMTKNGNITQTFTNFSVASVDGTNITVTCDWKPSPGFVDIPNTEKGPGPVLIFPQQVNFSPNNTRWIGSAVCTENSGKSIVAIVNQSRENLVPGTLRDVTSAYDGFNQ